MNKEIPIKNIYYMILYAYNKVKNKDLLSNKDLEKDSTLSDVIMDIFLNEANKIVKHGVYRDYNAYEEDSLFIKGKIDIKKSIRPVDVKKHIHHDQFDVNNPINKIIKHTLLNIIYSNVKSVYKKKAKSLLVFFNNVDETMINDTLYKSVILNKSNQLLYDFSLKLSVLINKKLIPNEQHGKSLFYDVNKDDETMSTIYEAFLRNFYRLHTPYKVNKRKYKWYLQPLESSQKNQLPEMETDIEINKDEDTKIIIDAKYYYSALNSHYEAKKLISANIYQMNSYLQHNLTFKNLRGILLYPSVNFHLNNKYIKDNDYTVEFITVDFNRN
ncbi:MAG: 5-methylcytosine restriction system specificity protein McrC, partial [bacterium]